MANKPLLYLDSKTTIKYGDTFQSHFANSSIVVVKNNMTANDCGTMGSAPKTITYSKGGNFPFMNKPGFFERHKEFPAKIYHIEKKVDPIELKWLNAKDRGTNKILYTMNFENLVVEPTFSGSRYKNFEKMFNDLKIPVKPGTVIFTEDDMKGLLKAFMEYILGDMVSYINRNDLAKGTLYDKSQKTPGNLTIPTKYRLEFVKRMILTFRDLGISLYFTGDGYAYGREEDLK